MYNVCLDKENRFDNVTTFCFIVVGSFVKNSKICNVTEKIYVYMYINVACLKFKFVCS